VKLFVPYFRGYISKERSWTGKFLFTYFCLKNRISCYIFITFF